MIGYKIHPACEVFPDMTDVEYAKLRDSIKARGVVEPITIHKGYIIDGKNRARACDELGIDCPTQKWRGGDSLVAWAVSKNLERRHLTPSRRAALGAELKPLFEAEASSRQTKGGLAPMGAKGKAAKFAADAVGTSQRSVERAESIKNTNPKKFAEVKAGKKTARAAEREIMAGSTPPKTEPIKDRLGHVVPDKLTGAFTSTEFSEICSSIQSIRKRVKALATTPLGSHVHSQSVDAALQNAWSQIKHARPYSLCGYCRAGPRGCKACCKQGWIPEIVYKNAPPEVQEAEF